MPSQHAVPAGRYLETLDVGRTTHAMYSKYLVKHVRPFVGRPKAGSLDAEVLDSLYADATSTAPTAEAPTIPRREL